VATFDDIKSYYENILQRTPSDDEVNSWVAPINSGALNIEQVKAAFINSPEAQNVHAVTRLYQAAFGRVPDKDGLKGWVNSGKSMDEIADGFVGSQEFINRYGSGNVSEAFVTSLYYQVLGRAPDADGLKNWMASGKSAAQIMTGFSESAEFKEKTATATYTFLDNAAKGEESYSGGLFDRMPAQPEPVGQTFTLAAGADVITGTANNDTINALTVKADGAASSTLTAFDSIDGAGGNDTLNIYSDGTNNPKLSGSETIKNVETINIFNSTTAFGTPDGVDASKFVGATAINQNGLAAAVTNLASTTTAGFKNVATATGPAALSVTAAAAATSANVALDGVKGTDTAAVGVFAPGENTAHLNVAGAALNAVTVSGSLAQAVVSTDPAAVANLVLGVTAGKDVQTLSVNTAIDTTLTVTEGANSTKEITTVDASASKGGVTYNGTVTGGTAAPATIKTGSGKDNVTVATATSKTVGAVVDAMVDTAAGDDKVTINTTGDGNTTVNTGVGDDVVTVTAVGLGTFTVNLGEGKDTIDLGANALRSNFRIDGRAGDDTLDTLKMAGKSLVAQDYALIKSVVSNIDMLSFTGGTAAVADASQLAQFKTLGFAGNAGDTVTSAVAAQSLETAGSLIATAKDYDATLTPKVYGDALTIKATGSGMVTAKGSSVNLSVDPGKDGVDVATSTLVGDFKTAAVTLTASQDFTDGKAVSDNKAGFTFGAAAAAETTSLTISGSGNAAVIGGGKLATIDASGLNGAYTVEAGGNKVGDIYGGLAFTGDAGVAETIKLGAGADIVHVASTYGKMDTIVGFDAVKESNNNTSVTDILTFNTLNTFLPSTTVAADTVGALAAKVTLSANATTLDGAFIEAAATSAATDTVIGKVVTFQFGGDTYLFQDAVSATNKTLLDNADFAVKLVGLVDFSKDFDAFVA
jgi:trimeric autotransporter adhesin